MKLKTKKILFPIIYTILCATVTFCTSMFLSSKFYSRAETVGAYAKNGSRIELQFAIDNPSHEAIKYNIDRDYLKYTKYYNETYIDENNNSFIIKDHNSKVLISDAASENYFDVNLTKGTFPTKDSFIVSEEVATYYSISDKNLPTTIVVDQIARGIKKTETLTICGIFNDKNNKFVNKPDFKKNVQSNYVIIGKDSDNLKKFGKYTDIIGIFTDDKISNIFAINEYEKMMGGMADFIAYDDYTTTVSNVYYSGALEMAKNSTLDYKLVTNKNTIVLGIGIVALIWLIYFAFELFKLYPTHKSIFFNTYVFTFLGIILALVILSSIVSIVISNSVLFFITIFSSIYLVIGIVILFCFILVSDILTDGAKAKKLLEEKYLNYQRTNQGMVSIIIPCYNGSNYVEQAICSALDQTYKNIEIIVVDDGSQDSEITKAIVDKYPSVQYFRKENGGVSSAMNFGIEKAKGRYINWLSHDDMLTRNSVEERIKFLISNDFIGKYIISTGIKYIDQNSKSKFRLAAFSSDASTILDLLCKTINGCSLLIPKEAFDDHKFRVGMIFMPDYDMWARLMRDGYVIKNLPKRLVLSRVHDKQITHIREDLHTQDFIYIFDEHVNVLFDGKHNKSLKKVAMILKRRETLHPFYRKYIDQIEEYLIKEKYFNYWDKFELKLNGLFAHGVKFLRKVTSK